jgi:hypothetical protein
VDYKRKARQESIRDKLPEVKRGDEDGTWIEDMDVLGYAMSTHRHYRSGPVPGNCRSVVLKGNPVRPGILGRYESWYYRSFSWSIPSRASPPIFVMFFFV